MKETIEREGQKYVLETARATTCARAVAGVFGRGIQPLKMIVKLNWKIPDGKGGLKPRGGNDNRK